MTGEILTFSLHNSIFGIDIKLVKEINRNIEYTPIPGARPHIAGLYNMRGQIVTLINLVKVLVYDECSPNKSMGCIILKIRPGATDYVGLLVDKLGDVVDIEDEWCEPLPANVTDVELRHLKEVVKLKHTLITIVDPEKIIE